MDSTEKPQLSSAVNTGERFRATPKVEEGEYAC